MAENNNEYDYAAYDFDALLNCCFEVEGLLSLMRLREEECPGEVMQLIKEKVSTLYSALCSVDDVENEAVDEAEIAANAEFEEAEDAAGDPEVDDPEGPAEDPAPAEEPVEAAPELPTEEAEEPAEEPELPEAPEQEPEPVEEPALPEPVEEEPLPQPQENEDDELPSPEFEFTPQALEDEVPELPAATDEPEFPAEEEPAISPSLFDGFDDFEFPEVPEPKEERPETLDRKLARSAARNIRHAFSLNDQFRFRRELFGGSQPAFIETLEMLQAMTSYEEAEDYLYHDLGWDRESEDVKDFLAVVKDHFES